MAKLTEKRIYEYACKACGELEQLRRVVDDRDMPVACKCGNDMVRKFSLSHFTI